MHSCFIVSFLRKQGTVHSRLKDSQIGLTETDVRPLICFCRHHNPRKKQQRKQKRKNPKLFLKRSLFSYR